MGLAVNKLSGLRRLPTLNKTPFHYDNYCNLTDTYRNDPKFSDRQAWANSADPDQTRSSLIRVYTVCHSVWILWTHYSMVEPHSSNFRVITTNVLGVRIFRKCTVVWANTIDPGSTIKILKFQTPEKFDVITLKFEQDGSTIVSCIQKMQMEYFKQCRP